jgi:hypothetical protein
MRWRIKGSLPLLGIERRSSSSSPVTLPSELSRRLNAVQCMHLFRITKPFTYSYVPLRKYLSKLASIAQEEFMKRRKESCPIWLSVAILNNTEICGLFVSIWLLIRTLPSCTQMHYESKRSTDHQKFYLRFCKLPSVTGKGKNFGFCTPRCHPPPLWLESCLFVPHVTSYTISVSPATLIWISTNAQPRVFSYEIKPLSSSRTLHVSLSA